MKVPSTCRPVSKTFLRGGEKVWSGGEKSWSQRVARESKLRSPPRQILFCTPTFLQLLLFLRPFVLHFSPPSFLACTVKARKEPKKGRWDWNGMGNEVGSEENRKSRDRDAVVPLLPAKIPPDYSRGRNLFVSLLCSITRL